MSGQTAALLSLRITGETDVVLARQRAREIAGLLGFDQQDQVRISTAVSEIGRNAMQYAGGGQVDYLVHVSPAPQRFEVRVTDRGPGIAQLTRILDGRYQSPTGMGMGMIGARRLMDDFLVKTSNAGTVISLIRFLPRGSQPLDSSGIAALSARLAASRPDSAMEELRRQNRELLQAMEELRRRHSDISQLTQELEETNRGVLALYAELDDRAASLRRADEVKSRFLSHMSHEFRTPLNSILALTRLLDDESDGPLNSEQRKQVSFVRSAASELSDMVNDLLDLAKVEAGRVDIRTGEVDVARLFGALRGMMRPLLRDESVRLIIEDPGPGCVLVTDESKLAQILRNLISNALKFTERGEVRVSFAVRDEAATFAVSDTGIGISTEDQQYIFQEFAQVDNPIQRRVKGTGLGLPLSRKLAELLGGTLAVRSETGAGSTFSLTLPAVATHEPATAEAEPQRPIVLIVDDDERARYLVRQLFHGAPYAISEAATGSEGLERARFERPALVFLDLNLPDDDGFRILAELRADPNTSATPVVIHTASNPGPADLWRLGGRHDAILPKSAVGSGEAYSMLQQLLATRQLPALVRSAVS